MKFGKNIFQIHHLACYMFRASSLLFYPRHLLAFMLCNLGHTRARTHIDTHFNFSIFDDRPNSMVEVRHTGCTVLQRQEFYN